MDAATTTRIAFKAVGLLPAPDDLPAPMIFVPMFHPFGRTEYGSVRVMDEDHSDRKTNYSFTPINPQDGWTEWMAIGWEDCEVCLLYTSPSPRDISGSRMPSSA